MFTWLNKQGVQSEKGFVVQSIDRFAIEYREGARKRSVYVENGRTAGGALCVEIAPNAFAQWDGDQTVLSLEKQSEMLQNFRDAMKFQGIEVIVNNAMDNET